MYFIDAVCKKRIMINDLSKYLNIYVTTYENKLICLETVKLNIV